MVHHPFCPPFPRFSWPKLRFPGATREHDRVESKSIEGTCRSIVALDSHIWRPLGSQTTVELGSARYYLSFATLELDVVKDTDVKRTARPKRQTAFSPPQPVVVINVPDDADGLDFVQRAVRSFLNSDDDVFTKHFLSDTVILQGKTPSRIITQCFRHGITSKMKGESVSWLPSRIIHLAPQPSGELFPEGPYFLTHDRALVQAWRLYPDTQDAFCITFVPDTQKNHPYTFKPLSVSAGDGLWRQVAVPSRMYSQKTREKPLAGMRISVKDNFKIAGIKTTQNNRAFVEVMPPEHETAEYIACLVDLGAIILGKTKMCAFASSEEPTDQWVDFHAPFNPRGDGYQTCSGSTSGGGASLASYPWMDFSVGTDTTGSIRWPAAWNGLFGLRTTWGQGATRRSGGKSLLEGVYPSCREMDTIGMLSRSMDQLESVLSSSIKLWPRPSDALRFPKRILVCKDFFPHANDEQQKLVEHFVSKMQSFLGEDVNKEDISIADCWATSPPPEDEGQRDIRKYLDKTAYYPFYYDGYNWPEFAQFREAYEEKFKKPVFLGPYMRWKWDQGVKVKVECRENAMMELSVYKRWFFETILRTDANGQSDAILVLPCGSSGPKYRDEPNAPPSPVPAFSPNYIASMLGLPQIVLPIGNIPYWSRISKRTEKLPVVASFAGAPGSDLMLVQLGRAALEEMGKPTKVETGRSMYWTD